MLRVFIIALFLPVVLAAAGPSWAAGVEARLTEYGLYEAIITGKETAPETLSGNTNTVGNLRHMRETREFVGQLGRHFGFRFSLSGNIRPGDPIMFRVMHPPLKHPNSGRAGKVDSWVSRVGPNMNSQYVGYTFEEPWELAEGEWIFQVIHDGEVLLTQRFIVRIPLN